MSDHLYLDSLIANTPNAIIAVDSHFRVFDVNPVAATVLGQPREQAIGQPCTQLLNCRNLNGTILCGTSSCPLTRVIQQKQAIAHEEVIIGGDPDHSREFIVSVTPVGQQYGTGVVFIASSKSRACKFCLHGFA